MDRSEFLKNTTLGGLGLGLAPSVLTPPLSFEIEQAQYYFHPVRPIPRRLKQTFGLSAGYHPVYGFFGTFWSLV
jgi:hypothetical protein